MNAELLWQLCNPISILFILTVLSTLFYIHARTTGKYLFFGPYIILGVGLILSVLQLQVVASGDLGLGALGVMLLIPVSIIISLIFFAFSNDRLYKFNGKPEVDNAKKDKKKENVIILYLFGLVDFLIVIKIIWLLFDIIAGKNTIVEIINNLPIILLTLLLVYAFFRGLSRDLYHITVSYYLVGAFFILGKAIFYNYSQKYGDVIYIMQNILYIIITGWLILKYLKKIQDQSINQLTQNQNEVQL